MKIASVATLAQAMQQLKKSQKKKSREIIRNRDFGFSKWQPLSPVFVTSICRCVATTAHW